MFSAAIELILNVAYREATVRRHTHLTLEHLLYVLAHDPEGEKLLTACGADLPALRHALDTFLDGLEQSKKGRQREPQQTLAFQRVLQTAVLHVQSAGKDEVRFGDVLAAILQQPNSYAAELLQSQDVTRLDVLNYISHGITKKPAGPAAGPGREPAPAGKTGDGPAPARDPLAAFAVNLTERATQGRLDPLIGRRDELRRTLQILCRRRKNNPVFVGNAGVGKTALRRGAGRPAAGGPTSPSVCGGRRSSPSTPPPCSLAHGSGATSRSASRPSSTPSRGGPCPSCSSTRCTRRWGRGPPPAARWTSRCSSSRCWRLGTCG